MKERDWCLFLIGCIGIPGLFFLMAGCLTFYTFVDGADWGFYVVSVVMVSIGIVTCILFWEVSEDIPDLKPGPCR